MYTYRYQVTNATSYFSRIRSFRKICVDIRLRGRLSVHSYLVKYIFILWLTGESIPFTKSSVWHSQLHTNKQTTKRNMEHTLIYGFATVISLVLLFVRYTALFFPRSLLKNLPPSLSNILLNYGMIWRARVKRRWF